MRHNAAEKEAKAVKLQVEKDMDKQMIEQALAREKAIQEIEE